MSAPSPVPSRWDRFKARSKTVLLHVWRWEPPWLIREILIVGLISAVVLVATALIDDRRAETDRAIASQQNAKAERLENLRFVRERSNPDPATARPFNNLDLVGQNLAGLTMTNADLQMALLRGAMLTNVDLVNANLRWAVLNSASLSSANLTGANLTGAYLRYATLHSTFLGRANLAYANLERANLTGANLTDANLERANLTGANLNAADLTRADLSSANLSSATLTGVCWSSDTKWPSNVSPPPPRPTQCLR